MFKEKNARKKKSEEEKPARKTKWVKKNKEETRRINVIKQEIK